MSAADALRRFEIENQVKTVDPDKIFELDEAAIDAQFRLKPWKKE